jgi:hypothetical protein
LKGKTSVVIFAPIVLAFILLYPSNVSAVTGSSENITVTPINDEVSLEKTISTMNIPEDKSLSWGAVKGKASDYVERYPVIIQFFKGDQPVHVAQVKVKGDGSYEYKFKIRNTDKNTGETINIFEGKYTVKIFKVIPNKNRTDI